MAAKKHKQRAKANEGAEPAGGEDLLIVGIGASAGGLRAMQDFFGALPEKCEGVAFVVITHLDPQRQSSLAEILQPRTSLQVHQVSARMDLEAGHVYVIPPNRTLTLGDHHLEVAEFAEPRGRRAPIDVFFRSLAASEERGVAVVLSGSGSDGTVGLKLIKEAGGLVLVQDPEDAEYDGMPRSAISTGLVDAVLPAAEMGPKILTYRLDRERIRVPQDGEALPGNEAEALQEILAQLRVRTGHDFFEYKPSTVLRRIGRRMQINQKESLSDYLGYLRENASEAQVLMKHLLISVTHFFRDQEAWEALATLVIPKLFEGRPPEEQLRVWVPGCATGEEPYTIAMLLMEEAARHSRARGIQIFASDLDGEALAHGRQGLYHEAIAADITEERLRRFFTREGDRFAVKKEVRDLVLFTQHGLFRDPPFSRLDLVSCRNLLIYLNRELQEKVFRTFHYSLRPDGYLFVGNAESVPDGSRLFRVLHKKHRISQRVETGEAVRLPAFDLRPPGVGPMVAGAFEGETPLRSEEASHRILLETMAPPSLVIGRDHELLHLSEGAGRYLQRRGGQPSDNVLREVRKELRLELQAALHQAFEHGRTISTPPIEVAFNGERAWVHLIVSPGREVDGTQNRALVMFAEVEAVEGGADRNDDGGSSQSRRTQATMQKLQDRLQATIEEYESSKEEMKASNEELQSINEEYKSTAEELETSKEELQSLNEELETVNQELKHKIEELSQANSDLQNLMVATEIGTLFLDRELRIKRYTPQVAELISMRPGDLGRSITDLARQIEYDTLVEDAQTVLRDLAPVEREVRGKDDSWFLMRLRPYRSVEDRIEGVVITFVEITRRKRSELNLHRSEQQLEVELRVLTRLHKLVADLLVCTDMAAALDGVLGATIESTDAEMGAILLLGREGQEAAIVAVRGFGGAFLERFRTVSAGDGSVSGRALQEVRRIVVADVREDPAFEGHVPFAEAAGFRAVQATPLVSRTGTLLGLLSTHYREPHQPTERELRIVDLHSRQAADFIERAQREEALRQLNEGLEDLVEERTRQVRELASMLGRAEQAERQRISEVLHDDLQQRLCGIQAGTALILAAAKGGDLESLEAHLAKIEGWLEEAVATTRRLSSDLSPPVLKTEGLGRALHWLQEQMRDRHGLEITVQASNGFDIQDPDLRILAFQIVRELLFNVVKHSGTKAAAVELGIDGEDGVIVVSDDGCGVKRDIAEKTSGWGLSSAQERLQLFGGSMAIDSVPGDGTRVTLRVPQKRGSTLRRQGHPVDGVGRAEAE